MQKRLLQPESIQQRIFTFREFQVMMDRDLAELYEVETKRLNEQVKRNANRFPERFCFQLTNEEKNELVANCDRFKSLKHASSNPYAFTEQGVAMLASVLRSDTAVTVSIQIIDSFVHMRKAISDNSLMYDRLSRIERKQLETDQQLEVIFNALENKKTAPQKGIFFDGQVFDAYTFVSDLIRKAKQSISIIDNYIDDSVLSMLSKKRENVKIRIYTKSVSSELALDLKKYNEQYDLIEVIKFNASHDRFLIIDDKEIYHIGASLKDLGKKWFAFSQMDNEAIDMLSRLKQNK